MKLSVGELLSDEYTLIGQSPGVNTDFFVFRDNHNGTAGDLLLVEIPVHPDEDHTYRASDEVTVRETIPSKEVSRDVTLNLLLTMLNCSVEALHLPTKPHPKAIWGQLNG